MATSLTEGAPSPRVVVVSADASDPWGEIARLTRRIAGALASRSNPEVGSVEVHTLTPAPRAPTTSDAPIQFRSFGPTDLPKAIDRNVSHQDPWQEELRALTDRPPEILVCVGGPLRFVAALPQRLGASARVYWAPLACLHPLAFDPPASLSHLRGVAGLLVFSAAEQAIVSRALSRGEIPAISNVGFCLRVHPLAATMPRTHGSKPCVLLLADWQTVSKDMRALAQVELLAAELPGIEIGLIGTGTRQVARDDALLRVEATGGMDLWRWLAGANAVVDLSSHGPLAMSTLECMMLGTPVLVPHGARAGRGHVEASSGGLTFAAFQDLVVGLRSVLENSRGRELAGRAKEYADVEYGDPKAFCTKLRAAIAFVDSTNS